MTKIQKFSIFLAALIFILLGVQTYRVNALNEQKFQNIQYDNKTRPIETRVKSIERPSKQEIAIKTKEAENEQKIKASWKDILFVGDSLTVGLASRCDLKSLGSTVDAEIGRNLDGCFEAIKDKKGYACVVITIGTNSCGMNNETFLELYKKMIGNVKENNPESIICVNTIPPCEENKAKHQGYTTTNEVLDEKNEIIKNLDEVIVLDLNEELKKKGYDTSDGIHLNNASYDVWFEFLKEKLNIIE